jgi:hypothetical protein
MTFKQWATMLNGNDTEQILTLSLRQMYNDWQRDRANLRRLKRLADTIVYQYEFLDIEPDAKEQLEEALLEYKEVSNEHR